jgi:hypothetical protein
MPEIYTAFQSEVKVNEKTIEGLQAIEYSQANTRRQIGAIGTDERIAVYFGTKIVEGRLTVASASPALDDLLQSRGTFSISATLRHGETHRVVAFDECYMEDKTFDMGAEGHGRTVYAFTARRLREGT